MYINTNFIGNPIKIQEPIPYCPIRLHKSLEDSEVEPIESTSNNYDLHSMMVSKELTTHSGFSSGRDSSHLGF